MGVRLGLGGFTAALAGLKLGFALTDPVSPHGILCTGPGARTAGPGVRTLLGLLFIGSLEVEVDLEVAVGGK